MVPPKKDSEETKQEGTAMKEGQETQPTAAAPTQKRYDRSAMSDPKRNAPLNALMDQESLTSFEARGMKWGEYSPPSYENTKRFDLPPDLLDDSLEYRLVSASPLRLRQLEAAGYKKVEDGHFIDKNGNAVDVPTEVTSSVQSGSEKQKLRYMAIPKHYLAKNRALKNAERRRQEIQKLTNEDGKGFLEEGGIAGNSGFYAPPQDKVKSGITVKEYSLS